MLVLGLSNFKALEKQNTFPFKRRMLGGAVRFSNHAVIEYIQSLENQPVEALQSGHNASTHVGINKKAKPLSCKRRAISEIKYVNALCYIFTRNKSSFKFVGSPYFYGAKKLSNVTQK